MHDWEHMEVEELQHTTFGEPEPVKTVIPVCQDKTHQYDDCGFCVVCGRDLWVAGEA